MHHGGLSLLSNTRFSNSAPAAVALSALLPDPMKQVPDGANQLKWLELEWPRFNLRAIAKHVDEEFQKLQPQSESHPSLANACEQHLAVAG